MSTCSLYRSKSNKQIASENDKGFVLGRSACKHNALEKIFPSKKPSEKIPRSHPDIIITKTADFQGTAANEPTEKYYG